jgi:hypothetical protein
MLSMIPLETISFNLWILWKIAHGSDAEYAPGNLTVLVPVVVPEPVISILAQLAEISDLLT